MGNFDPSVIFSLIKNKYTLLIQNIYDKPSDYVFVFVLLLFLFVFFVLSKTSFSRRFLLFVFTFPGTVIHEFLHFIVGVLTLARPFNFSLIPKKTNEGWTLGSVSFAGLNSFNAFPTAMAPILAPIILISTFPFVIEYIKNSEHILLYSIVYAFVLVSGVNECIPSSTDFKTAFSKPFGILFYFLIFLYFFLDFTGIIHVNI